ncbi:MAG: MOSC domain-containing protein [Pseudomonadota bacterium]
MSKPTLTELLNTLPQVGTVEWIGLRPGRRQSMESVDQVEARADIGLVGDRYAGRSGKRQVTLIQQEHLLAIASLLGIDECDPALLRRNIVVSGINLLALKDKTFQVGDAVLEYTGLCHPCSRMEETFGPGGYNAVRGHGGLTAKVVQAGLIRLGDEVRY